MSRSAINYQDLNDSRKALIVIFILLIAIFNVLLVWRLISEGNILHSVRRCLIANLACGDIFLALFSLVNPARSYFEPTTYEPTCTYAKSALMYSYFYFPFVYGIGLCFLCVELMKRRAISTGSRHPLARVVVFCGIPWLIGLVVMFPLAYRVTQYYFPVCHPTHHMSLDRARAAKGMATIFPCVLAVLAVAILYNFKNFEDIPDITTQVASPAALSSGQDFNLQAAPAASNAAFSQAGNDPLENKEQNPQGITTINQPAQSYLTSYPPNPPPGYPATHPPTQQSTYPTSQQAPTGYPVPSAPSQNPAPGLPATYQPPYVYTHQQPLGRNVAPAGAQPHPTNAVQVQLQKSFNACVCLLYVVFTFPDAIYTVAFAMNTDIENFDQDLAIIFGDGLMWWSFLRALALPALWAYFARRSRS